MRIPRRGFFASLAAFIAATFANRKGLGKAVIPRKMIPVFHWEIYRDGKRVVKTEYIPEPESPHLSGEIFYPIPFSQSPWIGIAKANQKIREGLK